MFVNGHIFLVINSSNIKFILIMNMQGRGATKTSNVLKTTISISEFKARQINIEMVVWENDFEAISKLLRPENVKIVVVYEHEGNPERTINTVKELTRCYLQNMIYTKNPKLMI